jgi:hypothetical protein
MNERSTRWLATGLYAALVSVLAFHHEMWRDEVRALSVAVQNPSWGTLFGELRHEGHPVVWYALLRVAYAVTHSNLVLPVIAATVGVITAWLIMKHAPYPLWIRLPALFGAFLSYALTVTARNYGIGVLLMISACIAFARRRSRPLMLGAALAIMANTSVHAALASLVLLAVWLFDLLRLEDRRALLSAQGLAAVMLVVLAVIVGLWTARPTADMAWAVSELRLAPSQILHTMAMDPGLALRGFNEADLGAVAELPWHRLVKGIDVPRIVVNLSLAWLLVMWRKDLRSLAAIVISILVFEVFFRNVYTGSLRHEGLLLFLFFAIGWCAIVRARAEGRSEVLGHSFALGLLPLFVMQSVALPIIAHRAFSYPESSSKAYAELIRASPRFKDAILMSEPDYMMESMPYYVSNRVYMPRQREFSWRVYFDTGAKRQLVMSLGRLSAIAEGVSCERKVPVLLAIASRGFDTQRAGSDTPNYKGTLFTWNEAEWERFHATSPRLANFPFASSGEMYTVHEVNCAVP